LGSAGGFVSTGPVVAIGGFGGVGSGIGFNFGKTPAKESG
jgi:hypothetical protein